MDVLADHVTSLNTHRETQTQLVKKLEEREKALQNAVVRSTWKAVPPLVIDPGLGIVQDFNFGGTH